MAIWLFKVAIACIVLDLFFRWFIDISGFFRLLAVFMEDSDMQVSAIAMTAILCAVIYTVTRP